MVNGGSLPLAENCPHVNEIICNEQNYNPTAFNELYEWNLSVAEKLWTRQYHLCYAFVHRPNTALLTYMSGARLRIMHPPEEVQRAVRLAGEGGQFVRLRGPVHRGHEGARQGREGPHRRGHQLRGARDGLSRGAGLRLRRRQPEPEKRQAQRHLPR